MGSLRQHTKLKRDLIDRLEAVRSARDCARLDSLAVELLRKGMVEDCGTASQPRLTVTNEGQRVLQIVDEYRERLSPRKRHALTDRMVKALSDIGDQGFHRGALATVRALENRQLICFQRDDFNRGRWVLTHDGERACAELNTKTA